jgi:gluconolactonase
MNRARLTTTPRFDRRALIAAAGFAALPVVRHSSAFAAHLQNDTASPAAGVRVAGPIELFVTGFDAPEGPAFDRDGNLYFVDSFVSAIVKVTPTGEASEFFNTGGIPAGLAFHPDGSLYVADEGEEIHGILRITPDGKSEIAVNEFNGAPLNGSNDLVFDRNGVLYFSDPWDSPSGGFYRLFPDGKLEQLDTDLAFPNGVGLNANESAVFLAESGYNRILRYSIAADGTLGPREEWALADGDPAMDGMAFDEHGDLYVAHYGAGHVDVFDPTGAKVEEIVVPGGGETTNVAFGGLDNKTLYITDVTADGVFAAPMNVAGQPLNDGRGSMDG